MRTAAVACLLIAVAAFLFARMSIARAADCAPADEMAVPPDAGVGVILGDGPDQSARPRWVAMVDGEGRWTLYAIHQNVACIVDRGLLFQVGTDLRLIEGQPS